MNKLLIAAIEAKKDGFVYMTSVVKSVFRTTYHHIEKIDDIIANGGKWPAAYHGSFPGKSGTCWNGPLGNSSLPEKSINKSDAIRRYCH